MTHEQRVYHHLYETLEGIAEQSERIASLEELVLDALVVIEDNCALCAWRDECTMLADCKCAAKRGIRDRMRQLGLEVD